MFYLSLLVAFFYLVVYNVSALPLCRSLDGSDCVPFFGPNVGRSLWNIVQSCLATIFACTWVSVHRNMPKPQSPSRVITWERLKITIFALLVPEWILGWAICQYFSARDLAKTLQEAQTRHANNTQSEAQTEEESIMMVPLQQAGVQERGNKEGAGTEWTLTHAFFAIMGGFYLYDEGEKPLPSALY